MKPCDIPSLPFSIAMHMSHMCSNSHICEFALPSVMCSRGFLVPHLSLCKNVMPIKATCVGWSASIQGLYGYVCVHDLSPTYQPNHLSSPVRLSELPLHVQPPDEGAGCCVHCTACSYISWQKTVPDGTFICLAAAGDSKASFSRPRPCLPLTYKQHLHQ